MFKFKTKITTTQYVFAGILSLMILFMLWHEDFDTLIVTSAVKNGLMKGSMSAILFVPSTGILYPVFSGMLLGVYEGFRGYIGD